MIRSIVVLCLVVACASAGWIPRTKKRYDPNAGKFLIDVSLQSRNALYFPELFEYLKNLTRDEEAPIRQHGLPTDRRKRIQLLEMLRTHRDIYPLFNKTDNIYRIMDERKALMGPEANKFFDMVFKKAVDLHYNYVASYKLAWTVVDDSAKSVADEYKTLSFEAQADLQSQFPEMKKALEGIAGITVRTTTPSTAAPTTTTTTVRTTTRGAPASSTAASYTTTTRSRSTFTQRPTTQTIPTQSPSTSVTNYVPSVVPLVVTVVYTPPELDVAVQMEVIAKTKLKVAEYTLLIDLAQRQYKSKEEYLTVMKNASPSLYKKYVNYYNFVDSLESLDQDARNLVDKFFAAHAEFLDNFILKQTQFNLPALKLAVQNYVEEYTQLSAQSKQDLKTKFRMLYTMLEKSTPKN